MTQVSFREFYRAVNEGREPFPWQSRLAGLVDSVGWPSEIGIPTGLGKTSCIEVGVWALARQASLPAEQRKAPTRIWYVVNRRLLVDSAYQHGCRIVALLSDPTIVSEQGCGDGQNEAVLREIAEALNVVGGYLGSAPLQATRMRGGAELGSRPTHPAQPALIFATLPMFASRLLFRGYGTSRNMRPVDAALAGIDSLVLLDEAHMARALLRLRKPLAQCDCGDPGSVLAGPRAKPVLVSLTATGDASEPFGLNAEDLENPIVRRRLDAPKPSRLVPSTDKKLVGDLAGELEEHLKRREPAAAIVFLNDPAKARSVFNYLRERPQGWLEAPFEVLLLTGSVREREGRPIRARLLDPATGAPARTDRPARSRHLIVVATQTLEVGADLDFDVLVTEMCGARSLIQRMGRLNRLGLNEFAAASILFSKDAKSFGIYGDEPKSVWLRLMAAAQDGVVNLTPSVASEVVGIPKDQRPEAPELLAFHLWEWAKTSQPPAGEAPPELFFDGFADRSFRVSIAWRACLPESGGRLVPPIRSEEAIEVGIGELRKLDPEQTLVRMAPDLVTIQAVVRDAVKPGDQLILLARNGGYDQFGWNPDSTGPVLDLSVLAPPGLPLVPEVLEMIASGGDALDSAIQICHLLIGPEDSLPDLELRTFAISLIELLKTAGPSPLLAEPEWELLMKDLRPALEVPVAGPPRLTIKRAFAQRNDPILRSEVFDELSFTATSPTIEDHVGSVGDLVQKVATSVGMPPVLVATLAAAGRFHDLGKVDDRFQRWLDPSGSSGVAIAKSSRTWVHWAADQVASGWPQGGRHEELSRRLVAARLAEDELPGIDRELLLHLIVSHHGHGRPLVLPVPDPFPTLLSAMVDGWVASVSGDLSAVDWDQPERFRRCCERYGYWGLALLEAILRQSDHQASGKVVAL